MSQNEVSTSASRWSLLLGGALTLIPLLSAAEAKPPAPAAKPPLHGKATKEQVGAQAAHEPVHEESPDGAQAIVTEDEDLPTAHPRMETLTPKHDQGVHGTHGGHRGTGHSGGHNLHRFHLGVNSTVLAAFANPMDVRYGGGAFVAFPLIPGSLEMEIVLHVLLGHEGLVDLPFDILLKKPWHVNRWLHPFIGVGPTVVAAFEPKATEIFVGGASATGIDFWVTRHCAIVAELNFNLIYRVAKFGSHGGASTNVAERASGLVPEIGGSVGVLLGL